MKRFFIIILMLFVVGTCFSACSHVHEYEKSVINPTAEAFGYTQYTCHCGDFYKEDYTCLVSFNSITESYQIDVQELPTVPDMVVGINTVFDGVSNTAEYKVIEYRVYNGQNYSKFNIGQRVENSIKISIVWDKIATPTPQENAFNDLLNKIIQLEEISGDYNVLKGITNISPNLRAMQYIRSARYNTAQWKLLAGSMENDFIGYINQEMPNNNFSSLQTIETITIPKTNEDVDFVHMVAVMNVICNGSLSNNTSNDLVGWLGDLCQLAAQIKNMGLEESKIYSKAEELFGANSSSSSFALTDLLADLDAINIMRVYDDMTEKSISKAIIQYYNAVTMQNRKSIFIETALDNETNSQILKINVKNRFTQNALISYLCSTEGLNMNESYDNLIVDSLIDIFINFILS